MNDQSRNQWLEESEAYFKQIKAYNSSVVSFGYVTFFGLLVFLRDADKTKDVLLFWAGLFVALSAIFFVGYELIEQIRLSLEMRKLGIDGRRFFRFWAFFFIPSVILAAMGVLCLLWLFLRELVA